MSDPALHGVVGVFCPLLPGQLALLADEPLLCRLGIVRSGVDDILRPGASHLDILDPDVPVLCVLGVILAGGDADSPLSLASAAHAQQAARAGKAVKKPDAWGPC